MLGVPIFLYFILLLYQKTDIEWQGWRERRRAVFPKQNIKAI